MGKLKIAIALPLTDQQTPTPFFMSYILMQKPDHVFLKPEWPDSIENIRNDLVKQAMNQDCSHIIMLDTDQTFPPDTITRLVDHAKAGRQVVGGVVHRRYPPFEAILLRGTMGKYLHIQDELCYSGNTIEVDATGCGCIMYDMNLFYDMPEPWFEQYELEGGKTVGEDIGLCSKLREKGVSIYADTSIQCGHLSRFEITADFYKLYKGISGVIMTPEELQQKGG